MYNNGTININKKAVLGYLFSPQLGRRIQNLAINTKWIAMMLVTIFETLRLLPPDHLYTDPKNLEEISIRKVLALSANNLQFDLKHSDQLIVYAAVLLGLVLLVAQLAVFAFILSTNIAHAQFMGFFQPPAGLNLQNDIAFSMLDQIFGIPNLYGTIYDPAVTGAIPPFTVALQSTFSYYNLAMSIVAAFLVVYFLFVVLVETVQDGTPFGQRFQSGYVPLRLIIALAFLVPTYYGFSTGQHLVLNVAKVGGHLATNSWIMFARAVENPLGNGQDKLLPPPKQDDVTALHEALLMASICSAYHRVQYWNDHRTATTDDGSTLLYNTSANQFALHQNTPNSAGDRILPINLYALYEATGSANETLIMAEVPNQTVRYMTPVTGAAGPISDYQSFMDATQNRSMRIRFGQVHPSFTGYTEVDPGTQTVIRGGIKPLCGEIVIPPSTNPHISGANLSSAAGIIMQGHLIAIQAGWYGDMYMNTAYRILAKKGILQGHPDPCTSIPVAFPGWTDCGSDYPPTEYYNNLRMWLDSFYAALYANAQTAAEAEIRERLALNAATNATANAELFQYGWAGAGMWYNRISDTYSAYKEVFKMPHVKSYPMILNDVAQAKRTMQQNAKGLDLFDPKLPDGLELKLRNPSDKAYAEIMSQVLHDLTKASSTRQEGREDKTKAFVNFINIIFGLDGVFNLRANGDVHPFGQLVAAGKGLIDSSVAAFTGTIFTTGISGYLSAIGYETGSKLGQMASGFASMAATIGLSAGIILFYVIPMTPFMYFFLAAGRWVKSIFEAMIAVPLWAMAHIRIDGTGLPGVAGNGYFLVFEIFLRPVLTLFGLLASMATYGALMVVFNDIFDLVVDNLANNDISATPDPDYVDEFRGTVDMFFYTILYAIVAYMMAMASFKLIDLIPDSILRWMGAGVKSFGDESGNIAEGLNRTISIQGMMTAQRVSGIAESIGGAGGSGAGGLQRIMGGGGKAPQGKAGPN